MLKITFSTADIEALRYWCFQHPDPRVQVRLGGPLLMQSTDGQWRHPAAVRHFESEFHRYLKAYVTGGLEQLKQIDHYRPQSQLASYCSMLEASFQEHPPRRWWKPPPRPQG
jgi:hypothetical protein